MTKRILFLSVLAAAASTVVAESPADLRKKALEVLAPLPAKMPGAENDTPALVSLGKKLYFEKRLSANNSQSCNSCHQVDGGKSGVDMEPTSPGAFGKRGGRNSPTTLAADLAAQAKGPILNPGEMAMPSEAAVIEKLSGIASYKKDFAKAFPDQASPLTYDNLAKAIAAFERTLVTHDRFDDFLKGNDRALSAAEQKGLETFISVGCTTCHNGPAIGGNGFRKVGAVNPYKNLSDKGRIEITKEEEDLHVFKVPALRNVALTAPYFHDGAMKSLADTVREMAWLQLGQKLNDDQVQSIVSFLRALNGKGRKGKDAMASVVAPTGGALPAMP